MKKLLSVCVAVLILFSSASAFAADVTGGWMGEIKTDDGPVQLVFTFKQDGSKLTGAVQASGMDPLLLHDGKIDGDKITFAVDYNGSTITDSGTVSGDTMQLKTTGGGLDGNLTLKRAPAAPAATPAAAAATTSAK